MVCAKEELSFLPQLDEYIFTLLKTNLMNPRLKSDFDKLETSRKNLFNSIKNYSDEKLNQKPSPEAWSVTQVLQHLITSEEASLRYLQKKTLDTSRSAKAGMKGGVKLFLTKLTFSIPIKFNSPETMLPAETFVPIKELETKWEKLRNDTWQLLSKLSDEELEKELWKHMLLGKMNIYQMLDFFDFHFERHRGQVERTIEKVNAEVGVRNAE